MDAALSIIPSMHEIYRKSKCVNVSGTTSVFQKWESLKMVEDKGICLQDMRCESTPSQDFANILAIVGDW